MLRLVSGENICGEVLGETKTHTSISDPLKLETQITEGYRGTALTYWIPLGTEPVVVPVRNDHVIVNAEVHEELENHYLDSMEKIKKLNDPIEFGVDSPEDDEYDDVIQSFIEKSRGRLH